MNSRDLIEAYLKKIKKEAFDPIDLSSRPTATQQEFFDDFGKYPMQIVRAANQSGKSQSVCRMVAWVLDETHPTWKRPQHWKNEPLLILVAGRTGKQLEDSLLPKIISYLEDGTYKIVRVGNVVQKLEHKNGNRVIFQSLENPNIARERLQSYVAHLVVIDEMSPTVELWNELVMRRQAKSGYLLASFTPLVHNQLVRKAIDAIQEPLGKLYKFHMLDNPIYSAPDKREEVIRAYSHLSAAERASRFFGEWLPAESAVWHFDYKTMQRELPDTYHTSWPHAISVDPAISSALGYVIAAKDPSTNVWYMMKSGYLKGVSDPNQLFTDVMRLTEGLNITRRICDPHETWFLGLSAAKGVTYITPYDKNNRKSELIKGLQGAMGSRVFMTSHVSELVDEICSAQYADTTSETRVRIKSGSDLHQADAAQYLVDCLPKDEEIKTPMAWHDEVRKNFEKQLDAKAKGNPSNVWNQRRLRRSRFR